MKSILALTTLFLTLAATSSNAQTKPAQATTIAPSAEANLYAAATPEPSRALLVMMGVAGLAVRRRR